MNCPNCGKELLETATLCTNCGWKSKKWEEVKQTGKMQHSAFIVAMVSVAVMLIIFAAAIAVILKVGN